MAGISEPGLMASGFWIHSRRFSGVFRPRLTRSCYDLSGASDQDRTAPLRPFPRSRDSSRTPLLRKRAFRRSPFHSDSRAAVAHGPTPQRFGTVHRNLKKHLGVLCAAILRALPEINSSPLRVHPHFIYAIRNQVGLPRKLGTQKL